MVRTQPFLRKEKSAGDTAVDGLCSGVVAGAATGLYLVLIGVLLGQGPAVVLGRFDPGGGTSPLTGALAQLAVSGVYGALFGLAGHMTDRCRPHLLGDHPLGAALWVGQSGRPLSRMIAVSETTR